MTEVRDNVWTPEFGTTGDPAWAGVWMVAQIEDANPFGGYRLESPPPDPEPKDGPKTDPVPAEPPEEEEA